MRLRSVTIDFDRIVEREQEAASRIQGHTLDLELRVFEFRVVVGLFQHLSVGRNRSDNAKDIDWEKIARTGAIAASTFWHRLQTIREIEAPNLWSQADVDLIDRAVLLFASEFPGIVKAAKIAAILTDPLTDASNSEHPMRLGPAFSLPIGFTNEARILPNMLKYTGMWNNEKLVCRISFSKAEALEAICELCRRAFRPLEPAADTEVR